MNQITKREQEVLYLIAYEYSSKEIATKLYVSNETVNSHRKNLLRKMEVKNTAGLVRVGIQKGIVRLSLLAMMILMANLQMSAQAIGLHVAENHNVLFGTDTVGAGTRLMWLPAKKSFLAGQVTGTQWNPDSIGSYNAVWGEDNKVLGDYTTLNGHGNTIEQSSDFTVLNGKFNTIEFGADYTILNGRSNTIGRNSFYNILNGSFNTIGQVVDYTTLNGKSNTIGDFSNYTTLNGTKNMVGDSVHFATVYGESNIANTSFETVLGRYADTTVVSGYTGDWVGEHQLFAVGNGTSTTARNNALTVLKNGNVGINTASPRGHFDINVENADIYLTDDVNGSVDANSGNVYLPGHVYLAPFKAGSDISYLQARRGDNSGNTHLQIRTYNAGNLTEAMKITNIGNVEIPGCYKSGGARVAGTCPSDARLKNNISSLSTQLMLLNQLRPVAYDWIDEADGKDGEIGLIAQEVEKIIPDMVVTGADGIKRIKYDISLQIRTIKAMQEQQELITDQAKDLEIKDQKLNQLEERLLRLERLLLAEEE